LEFSENDTVVVRSSDKKQVWGQRKRQVILECLSIPFFSVKLDSHMYDIQ